MNSLLKHYFALRGSELLYSLGGGVIGSFSLPLPGHLKACLFRDCFDNFPLNWLLCHLWKWHQCSLPSCVGHCVLLVGRGKWWRNIGDRQECGVPCWDWWWWWLRYCQLRHVVFNGSVWRVSSSQGACEYRVQLCPLLCLFHVGNLLDPLVSALSSFILAFNTGM